MCTCVHHASTVRIVKTLVFLVSIESMVGERERDYKAEITEVDIENIRNIPRDCLACS